MLDIQLLRSNLAAVAERLATRGVTLSTWDGLFWQAGGSWYAHLDTTES